MSYLLQYDHRMHQLQSQQSLASGGSHLQLIQIHVRNRSLIFEPDLF